MEDKNENNNNNNQLVIEVKLLNADEVIEKLKEIKKLVDEINNQPSEIIFENEKRIFKFDKTGIKIEEKETS